MRTLLLLLLLVSSTRFLLAEEAPRAFLEKRVNELLAALRAETPFEEKKAKVNAVFMASFDMVQLSGMALGREVWQSISDEDKKAFIEKYTRFLLSFYTSNMKDYKGEGLEMGDAVLKSNGKKAEVPFKIMVGGKSYSLTYSLKMSAESWEIYDVEIEGVRLSTQFRNQFTATIKKDGFKGLLAELDQLILKQSEEKK